MKWLNDNWFKIILAGLAILVSIYLVGFLKAEKQQAGRLNISGGIFQY